MGKIYWNNLDPELEQQIKESISNMVIPDGTTITKSPQGVISVLGGSIEKPTTRHWYTAKVVDPLDPSKKVFVIDFDTVSTDFLIVIFNGEPLGRTEFEIVEDAFTGNYIRINTMRPIDYDVADVQGYLLRGFNTI